MVERPPAMVSLVGRLSEKIAGLSLPPYDDRAVGSAAASRTGPEK